MKLTKMIYIASPYSPVGWQKVFSWFVKYYRSHQITKIIGKLQDMYPYAFIGPITQSHHTAKHMRNKCGQFKSWARRDLTYISKSDEIWVVMIPGWEHSIGVLAEIKFAQKHRISIKYFDPDSLTIVVDLDNVPCNR